MSSMNVKQALIVEIQHILEINEGESNVERLTYFAQLSAT